MGEVVMKIYTNITNIVVRISCGDECDKNSILLNSHFDSQIVTPGACDDAASVSVMLEIARIVSQRRTPLRNSLILLFNGAEESFQDASHAFVTTNPLAKNVRAFVNLEAMGNHGKEGMVDAYKAAPYPHGSVVSNDIFMTGLILSDTDFRQFVDHGDMHGIDMAIYQNSFTYHSMMDIPENVEKGLLQHMGENTLAIVQNLLGDVAIEDFTTGRLFFVAYDWSTADAIHAAIILTAVLLAFRTSFVGIFANTARQNSNDTSNKDMKVLSGFAPLFMTFLGVGFNMGVMVVAPALQGAVMQFVVGKPLTYFRGEALAFLLHAPAAIAGLLCAHLLTRLIVPAHTLDNPVHFERRTWNAVMLWNALFVLLTTLFRLGSAFLFSIVTVSLILGHLIDRLLTPSSVSAPNGSNRPIHPLAYAVAYPLTASFGVVQTIMGLNLFVPLAGRIGATSPVDVIVGGLVGLLSLLSFSSVVTPFLARVARRKLVKACIGTVGLVVLVVAVFASASFPYDELHPKRVFIQYMQNATSGRRTVHISHSDPPYMQPIVESVEKSLNLPSQLQSVEENDHSWATLFPFSHFIESHVFDVTEGLKVDEEGEVKWLWEGPPAKDARVPVIEARDVSWDAEKGTRTLTLNCYHPEHVWTVISFNAEVLSWSLESTPQSGLTHHVIRHAGSYGTNLWNFTLTVRAPSATDLMMVHLTGVERETFTLEPYTPDSKAVVAQLGWLWGPGFESARVLRKVHEAVPHWATELFLATVVTTTEV
ncbi:hypothetical protein BC829DRAFT_407996 [Chytridium lagenaria]|nr:hypothetical protein BC829DRAFT_407996 [Chytridium lagenaria]